MVQGRENRFWKWKNKKLTTPLSAHQKSCGPPFSSSKKSRPTPIFYRPPCRIMNGPLNQGRTGSRILDILILQDKTLFCELEAGDIVCWLVNLWIAKLDLFKSTVCRWIIKLTQSISYKNSTTVRRLVQSPTLQSTIFCGVHNGLRGKGVYECHPGASLGSRHEAFLSQNIRTCMCSFTFNPAFHQNSKVFSYNLALPLIY